MMITIFVSMTFVHLQNSFNHNQKIVTHLFIQF